MSKLSFKCFLESQGVVIGEGLFDFLKGSSKFLTTPDGEVVLDKQGDKILKNSLSPIAAQRAIARFIADKKDPTKPRSEKDANEQLADTAEFSKKVKATLDPKSKSFR